MTQHLSVAREIFALLVDTIWPRCLRCGLRIRSRCTTCAVLARGLR